MAWSRLPAFGIRQPEFRFPGSRMPRAGSRLDQFQLSRLDCGNSHTLDLAIGGFQNFEAQAVFLNCFALAWNSSSEFADQPGDGSRFLPFGLGSEDFTETVDIHCARDNESAIAVAHDFRLVTVVADLTYNLFHQIFDRN